MAQPSSAPVENMINTFLFTKSGGNKEDINVATEKITNIFYIWVVLQSLGDTLSSLLPPPVQQTRSVQHSILEQYNTVYYNSTTQYATTVQHSMLDQYQHSIL